VDCIRLEPAEGVTEGLEGWHFPMTGQDRADALRERYRTFRHRHTPRSESHIDVDSGDMKAHHQAEIAAALARVRAKRGKSS
jgi:hypothetical protein